VVRPNFFPATLSHFNILTFFPGTGRSPSFTTTPPTTATSRTWSMTCTGGLGRCGCAIISQQSDTRRQSDARLRGDRASASFRLNPFVPDQHSVYRSSDAASIRTSSANACASRVLLSSPVHPSVYRSSNTVPTRRSSANALASTALLSSHSRFDQTRSSALITAHDSWPSMRPSPIVSRIERDRRHKSRPSTHQHFSAFRQHLLGPKHSSSLSKIRASAREKERVHTKRTVQRAVTLRCLVISPSSLAEQKPVVHRLKLVHSAHAHRPCSPSEHPE
jgi:hypothetical protein